MRTRTVFSNIRVEPEIDIRTVDYCSDPAGHDDADKYESELSKVEAIHWWIDERESHEEGIVDSINKTCVETMTDQHEKWRSYG